MKSPGINQNDQTNLSSPQSSHSTSFITECLPLVRRQHSPHPSISLHDLDAYSLNTLKRINSTVLPSQYSSMWYRDSLKVGQLAKLAFFDDEEDGDQSVAVGAIRCAVDNSETGVPKIYIMTLAVLAAYREYGVATMLLEHIAQQAKISGIHQLYVHAWTDNEAAIEWYENRGFEKSLVVKGYYWKMRPPGDAVILTLNVV